MVYTRPVRLIRFALHQRGSGAAAASNNNWPTETRRFQSDAGNTGWITGRMLALNRCSKQIFPVPRTHSES